MGTPAYLALPSLPPMNSERQLVSATVQIEAHEAEKKWTFMQMQLMLAHNDARKEVGVAPLQWDERLEKHAQKYAQYLADHDKFDHDPNNGVIEWQGENLWKGTRGAFGYAQMADGWVSEKKFYKKDGIMPDVSVNGNWTAVGHYTQIIWRSTTHVGCAIASNDTDDILVCRYSPAGNVMGQHPIHH